MADAGQASPPKADCPPRDLLLRPQIRLRGTVDECMLDNLLEGIADAEGGEGPLALEVTTLGGDADIGRRMVLELDLARERLPGRRLVFIGKTVVYSAGITVMSAFPCKDRFLTADASLLIHCRQMEKTLNLSGPLRSSLPEIEAMQHQLKLGIEIEEEGFNRLIDGSNVTIDDLLDKALYNWYIRAEDAVEMGLVAEIV